MSFEKLPITRKVSPPVAVYSNETSVHPDLLVGASVSLNWGETLIGFHPFVGILAVLEK
jgi:hypothetical protein